MLTVKSEQFLGSDMFNAEDFIMDSTVTANSETSQANNDAQLFSTLCEIDKHNYLFLFERCKATNVNARQLRYLEKEHIRRIIPPDQVGIMAEFEFVHSLWRKQFQTQPQASTRQPSTDAVVAAPSPPLSTTSPPVLAVTSTLDSSTSGSPEISPKVDDVLSSSSSAKTIRTGAIKRKFDFRKRNQKFSLKEGEHEFPLDEIIKHDMRKVREDYKKNGILTERERRRLANALVEYFKGSDIYMSKDIMESLAIQISTVFPTESKLAWHDTEGKQRRGRLTLKLYNMQRAKKLQRSKYDEDEEDHALTTKNIDIDETTDGEPAAQANDSEAERSQEWLRINKFEDNDELLHMWYATTKYRTKQLKEYITPGGEHLHDVFEKWPAYKQPIGKTLISIDFNTLYPNGEKIFQERWPIFMQKIHKLYKLEVRLDLYDHFYKNANTLNEETKQWILIKLLHAIVRPTRPINPKQMARRYAIVESENAFCRIISNTCQLDEYTEAQPMIFIQGAIFNVEKVFVVFKDIRYEMKFMDALLTCLQIFLTFKLDFPLACLNFWTFVEVYFCNITPEPGTNLAVIDHIIKFLLA